MMSFGTMRLLFGLVGPIFLTFLTWKTVELEATQSATGILYAVLALVLVGEASALYLSMMTILPM